MISRLIGEWVLATHILHFVDAVAHRYINTTSDTELLLDLFAESWQPLKDGQGQRLAGESVVADASNFRDWEDVKPGEAVIITRNGVSRQYVSPPATFALDLFEHVYFARPDSVLDGVSVYRSRMAMGDALAEEVERVLKEHDFTVDVVIPVPDTSRVATLNLALKPKLPYREGSIKNRYVGRTFIPGQQMRRKYVRRKLDEMALEHVRTRTCSSLTMAKDVGAKKHIVMNCAPPIQDRHALAHGARRAQTQRSGYRGRHRRGHLVIFQTLPDLIVSVRSFNPAISAFDCSVFTGESGSVLERLRADTVKQRMQLGAMVDKGGDASDTTARGRRRVARSRPGVVGP
ncbi:phosphoribosyltransferase-like protein [Daedaleopsis nitida]|nr:phosphoribosyltransferase-like protein [Daedaleopsis nitida]